MPAQKKAPPIVSSPPLAGRTQEGGIRIAITNQYGQRYRYRAQAVALSMRKGELQVVENDGRCFLWFDHCDLKVRDGSKNLLLHLKTGTATQLPDAEFVILAELLSARPKAKTRRVRTSPPPAASLIS